jgi:hypothetical protein
MSRISDLLRTTFRIRKKRRIEPPGELPGLGSRLVLEGLRMKIAAPLSDDTWQWMVLRGWRECRFRRDRRRYFELPKGAFERLRRAGPRERERVHRRIIDFADRAGVGR